MKLIKASTFLLILTDFNKISFTSLLSTARNTIGCRKQYMQKLLHTVSQSLVKSNGEECKNSLEMLHCCNTQHTSIQFSFLILFLRANVKSLPCLCDHQRWVMERRWSASSRQGLGSLYSNSWYFHWIFSVFIFIESFSVQQWRSSPFHLVLYAFRWFSFSWFK